MYDLRSPGNFTHRDFFIFVCSSTCLKGLGTIPFVLNRFSLAVSEFVLVWSIWFVSPLISPFFYDARGSGSSVPLSPARPGKKLRTATPHDFDEADVTLLSLSGAGSPTTPVGVVSSATLDQLTLRLGYLVKAKLTQGQSLSQSGEGDVGTFVCLR
jgi:hypothetical protein